MKRGVAPYVDRSEPLGLSRSGWGWEARLADFDNDGVLEAMQATGFVQGEVNRWPELQELAMGNDTPRTTRGAGPASSPATTSAAHVHNPFFVRAASGPLLRPGRGPRPRRRISQVSRGIATADVDGDGDLDFAVANQWEPSVLLHATTARPPASFLGLRRPAAGRLAGIVAGPRVAPRACRRPRRAGRRSAPRPSSTCRTAGGWSPRSTAATATRASAAPTSTSASASLAAAAPLPVDLAWRGRATARSTGQTLRLARRAGTRLLLGELAGPGRRSAEPCSKTERTSAWRRCGASPSPITVFNVLGHTLLGFEQSWAQPLVGVSPSATRPRSCSSWSTRRRSGGAPASAGGLGCIGRLPAARPTSQAWRSRCSSIPNERLLPIAFAAAAAIASKYLFRVTIGEPEPPLLQPVELRHHRHPAALPLGGRSRQPYMFTENLSGAGDWILPAVIVCLRHLPQRPLHQADRR